MKASEIILQQAIERFIKERKATKILPNKSTIAIYAERIPFEKIDESLVSVVMTNPYTGEDIMCKIDNDTAVLDTYGEQYYIQSAIGNISRLFADTFDMHTEESEEYGDNYEKITINGGGALYEVILDNIDVFDKLYEKKHNDRHSTLFEIPDWLSHRNYKDDDKDLEKQYTDHWIDKLKGKYVFVDKYYDKSYGPEYHWGAEISDNDDFKYDDETGVIIENYDCSVTYDDWFDSTGGFESSFTCGYIKLFASLIADKCNIRVVKTTDAIPGYSSKKLLENFEKRDKYNVEQTNKLYDDFVKNIDDAKHYITNLYAYFEDLGCDLCDEYHDFKNLLNAEDMEDIKYIFKFSAYTDRLKEYIADQIFRENFD